MGSKRWPASLAAMGLGLGALALVPLTAGASSAAPHVFRPAHLHARFDVGIQRSVTPAQLGRLNAATAALKTFTTTVTDPRNSKTYKYSMVGTNPAVKGTTSSTAVPTYLVPVLIKFPGGLSWSPSVKDSCDSGATPLARTQNSPVFVSRAWTFGGTAVGTGQYTDAFQRASFWKYTQPTGTNPSFAVSMTLKTLAKITISVPAADAAVATGGSCGNGDLGAVNINWLQNYLEKTAIPALASQGVKPNTFPIFLLHNVVGYVKTTANCCVLGYHNAFSVTAGTQTYGVADYDNSGFFSGVSDVEPLSHEAAEWMDDPSGANPTAPWGNVGQVSGCQSNLEVGDPLSGTTINVSSGGFTYHVQELAFFSWFYHQSPSLGVKGWYSNNGTFTSPAAPCP